MVAQLLVLCCSLGRSESPGHVAKGTAASGKVLDLLYKGIRGVGSRAVCLASSSWRTGSWLYSSYYLASEAGIATYLQVFDRNNISKRGQAIYSTQ